MAKRISALILILCMVFSFAACGDDKANDSSVYNPDSSAVDTPNNIQDKVEDAGNPKNDKELGLRNLKIDSTVTKLTEEQKLVLQYFDNDYFHIDDYEFLQRYPLVFEKAQVSLSGRVAKVLSSNADTYEIVLWLVRSEDSFFYRSQYTEEDYQNYLAEHAGDYVVIKGKQSATRLIEGDYISVYGRYISVDTYEIDGSSYTVPTINAYREFINNNTAEDPTIFDAAHVKKVAKTIFGDDIEIREPVMGEDVDENTGWRALEGSGDHFFVVEPENQSNAKFTKFRFYTAYGLIEDAKSGSDDWLLGVNSNIDREIQFTPDFEHFLLFTYDNSMKTLTLEYYDLDFNKVWKREFEETQNAKFDYTSNNIYLVANNELYIINTETGEDTFSPKYIGERLEVRKLRDGILLISSNPADAIMKTDLEGNIVWKTNIPDGISSVKGIQLVGDNISIDTGNYYIISDSDGSVVLEAKSLS